MARAPLSGVALSSSSTVSSRQTRSRHSSPYVFPARALTGRRRNVPRELQSRQPIPPHACLPPNLVELLSFLRSDEGLRTLAAVYRENMAYKVRRYEELVAGAAEDVRNQEELVRIKMPDLKRVANVAGEQDNWPIFDSVGEQYRDAKSRSATFENVLGKARAKLGAAFQKESPSGEASALRAGLVAALQSLAAFSSSQRHIVEKVVDIVASFLKSPTLFRERMMNFMFLGGPGTGKTTIAREIGNVFASAGMYVSGQVVEAGRADLVGQYEGQTVARTRNFLVSNLDNGVIFLDEAYSVTPWDRGKPEGYGLEAATAMVEFMTQFPGLYCLIVAGYETPMVRYFLSSNEGMSRRFPNKFVLADMSPYDLVSVFRRKLVECQGLDPRAVSGEQYFDAQAWSYLHRLAGECTRGRILRVDEYDDATKKSYQDVRVFVPEHPRVNVVFENQAGSMSNLADEAIAVMIRNVPFGRRSRRTRGSDFLGRHGIEVMREIVRKRIASLALSELCETTRELERVERVMS